jgi:hypothetical protein
MKEAQQTFGPRLSQPFDSILIIRKIKTVLGCLLCSCNHREPAYQPSWGKARPAYATTLKVVSCIESTSEKLKVRELACLL